jgi:hypothetical protein
VSTIGSRYAGDYKHVLWDFEGMYQFGDWVNQGISADAYTTGIGYDFKGLPLDPQFWVYYDFASGDHNPGVHDHGTFNQLFPLGHAYFGQLELVGRQNIQDVSFQAVCFPAKWITAGAQYHILHLDSARDALYNANGTAILRDPTGASGRDVGQILDLYTNFHLSLHQDVLIGFNQLYSGSFVKRQTGLDEISLFYAQWSYRW